MKMHFWNAQRANRRIQELEAALNVEPRSETISNIRKVNERYEVLNALAEKRGLKVPGMKTDEELCRADSPAFEPAQTSSSGAVAQPSPGAQISPGRTGIPQASTDGAVFPSPALSSTANSWPEKWQLEQIAQVIGMPKRGANVSDAAWRGVLETRLYQNSLRVPGQRSDVEIAADGIFRKEVSGFSRTVRAEQQQAINRILESQPVTNKAGHVIGYKPKTKK